MTKNHDEHMKFFVGAVLVMLLAFSLRLYHITAPVADWHSWRQSDTAAVARNFLKFGFDPLRPRYDDLSNIQSGKDNPHGWRMVEFPLYQLGGAAISRTFPQVPIEVSLRLFSAAASAATALFLMLIVRRYTDALTGLLTGFVYSILPYSVYFGRTILPETLAVCFAIASIYAISVYTDKKKSRLFFAVWVFVSAVFAGLALLVKPTAAFLLVPALYLFVRHPSRIRGLIVPFIAYGIIAVMPLLLWRKWILQFPEGIPVYEWLLNAGNIRFKGAWFNWLFAERVGKLILGYWGLIPFGFGLVRAASKKEQTFYYWWIVGVLLYFIVFAAGNVQHDYYQILAIPVISVFLARGLALLLDVPDGFSRVGGWVVAGVSVLCMIAFSWYTIRTYYWINRPEIVEVGRLADSLLPKNAKVIAPYNGDTTFLYQTNRQGWPLGFDIPKKLQQGATHYVTVSPTDADLETRDLAAIYTVLVRTDKYAIIDLTKPKNR